MEDQAGLERIIVNNERIYIDVYALGLWTLIAGSFYSKTMCVIHSLYTKHRIYRMLNIICSSDNCVPLSSMINAYTDI